MWHITQCAFRIRTISRSNSTVVVTVSWEMATSDTRQHAPQTQSTADGHERRPCHRCPATSNVNATVWILSSRRNCVHAR